VRLRKDKVVVVLENRIYVYNFSDLRLIDAIDTYDNPKGLCAISADPNFSILANPDKKKGQIRITNYDKNTNLTIEGHQNSISSMNLNFTGALLASASDKGTIIRLFNTETGDAIQEVRRGSDKAEIYSLSFDKNSNFMACSSDKGTIHIFSVSKNRAKIAVSDENAPGEDDKSEVKNKKHV
jgi:WD repeat-containing protein 45